MVSIYDVLKASKGIHVEDSFAEIWGRKLRGGYEIKTLTGVPPFTFTADGEPLIDLSMSGQTVQSSTPTPANPVAVEGVGTLSGSDYIIPVTCGGTTTNIYLGSASTTRRIKKLVLTGEEYWRNSASYPSIFRWYTSFGRLRVTPFSTHYKGLTSSGFSSIHNGEFSVNADSNTCVAVGNTSYTTVEDFKQHLADQLAAGTPVTIWYVLAEPETAAVNEPLMKIGTYADELTKTGAGVNISTVSGSNTLTVGTTVQPSSMSITFMGK